MIKITFERTKKEKRTDKKKGNFVQYSKKVLTAMIVMWFLGAVLGFVVVGVQLYRNDTMVNLSDVLVYIGAPMGGGIVSYMIKSAWEKQGKRGSSENYTENIM